jgi:pilus assembly protein CpaE
MDSLLHLAIVTNDHFRADAVAGVVAGMGWRLESAIGQPQPLAWLRRSGADIVLVDLDVANAIGLLREITGALPQLTLLALATPQHLVELQDALLAGASSFIAFPIDPGQLTSTVLRAVQESTGRKAQPRKGRLVALAGLKGGVGRSTLAVNLAAALRQRIEAEVVVVEAHHGLSDLSLMLNLLPRHTLATLAQESHLDADVVLGHLQPHASKIKVLAAPPDLAQLVELPVESWRMILGHLRDFAPYVVVDTAAAADPVLSEVLTLADDVLVVTGPDLAGLRSAVVLLQSLDEEEHVHARTHVVLNRAGVRGGVSEAASSTQIGEKIVAAIPDDPALATFALNRGVPFVLSHPRSILSRKLHELAGQVFDLKPAPQPAAPAARRLFARRTGSVKPAPSMPERRGQTR